MNRRITLPELADGVAKRATVPVSFAEKFVQSFFDVVEEALVKEKLVKVKGLGTFKLVDVDARESVDVNSGERILLAPHSKVTFTPDTGLRDAINRPFADFETVILNDTTPTEKMEAIENEQESATKEEPMAETLATVASATEPELVVAEPKAEEDSIIEDKAVAEEPSAGHEPVAEASPEIEEVLVVEDNIEASEPIEAEPAAAAATAQAQALQSTEPQPAATETSQQENSNQRTDEQESNMTRRTIQNILAALLCLFIGYAICYYFRPFELPTLSPAPQEQKATKAEQKETQETNAPTEAAETAETTYAAPAAPAAKPAQSYPQLEGGEYEIVGVKGTEVMSPGKTLLNISLKYYKSTDFVPYICKMNGIDNPDIVPLDKELQIPELKKK